MVVSAKWKAETLTESGKFLPQPPSNNFTKAFPMLVSNFGQDEAYVNSKAGQ